MSDEQVWGIWSEEWILRDIRTERPTLAGLDGRIVTLDHPGGRRESWKVTGSRLEEIPTRLCSICRETPVGPGGQMCLACHGRIGSTAMNNPYGWMEEGGAES